jgi:hypothetical protein
VRERQWPDIKMARSRAGAEVATAPSRAYKGIVLRSFILVTALWAAGVAGAPPPEAAAGLAMVRAAREGGQNGRASYQPPRTPWGDPDLQGTYTNKYEQSTPLERPAQFVGRRVEDVTAAELADVLEKRNTQVIERAAGVGPLQFRDPLDVTKGSRAWLIVDPPDGKIPPLTPAARARLGPPDPFQDTGIQGILNARQRTPSSFDDGTFNSIEDFGLWERCVTRGLPGAMMPHILGNSYEIVQAPGLVAIRYELIHDVRVIPLDGRPHAAKSIDFEMGDARGRWEGDALIIETTNFKDRSTYRNANAATFKLVERFTRTSADKIEWTVTVDDPTTWTRPWTFSMPLTKTDAEPVLEFACHEGNYAVPHILSGARAAERTAGASKQPQ